MRKKCEFMSGQQPIKMSAITYVQWSMKNLSSEAGNVVVLELGVFRH